MVMKPPEYRAYYPRRYISSSLLWAVLLFASWLSACIPSLTLTSQPADSQQPEIFITHSPMPAATTTIVEPATPSTATSMTLRLWLPPDFDPGAQTPAAALLQARLEEFLKRRPGVRLDIRIKALSGPGGMLDGLTAASAAAPLALPDLVLLPKEIMDTAAIKGLLHPFDEHTQVLSDVDWYAYAVALSKLQNSTFGLPFACDALVLVYRADVVQNPPGDWVELQEMMRPVIFPAADEQALFTLSQYRALGGRINDEEGRPIFELNPLTQVLELYRTAGEAEVIPYWTTQFQETQQVWQAFLEGRADMAVIWASQYLQERPDGVQMAPLPVPGGQDFTLGACWVWSLATPADERWLLSVEFAEFFAEAEFLAEWTRLAGFLPPRPGSLQLWPEEPLVRLLERISRSAQPLPSADLLNTLGTPLQQATIQVLMDRVEPLLAAQEALAHLGEP